ncbi:MAG: serine/threonine-protein kinase, partial [Verrucomicrobiota bacterium]
ALSPNLARVAVARERFLREARAAAKLESDCILPIYEVDEGTAPWFAMRYVEGGTLGDRIGAEKTLAPEELAKIGHGIAKALETAHAEGVQHRDIKPENILLSEDGDRLWVCDFGIARCSEDPSLTYPGAIAGTPRYMSPEQAAGHKTDERSDLFSLGLLLYRCATGESYFRGTTTTAILAEATGDAKDVAGRLSHLPDWFRQLVLRLLEPHPADRPATASEVVVSFEQEASAPSRSWRRRSRRRILLPLTAAITLLLVGWGAIDVSKNLELPSVRIGEQGPAFDNLAEAIDAAPPGAELLLQGDFTLSSELWVKKPLSLRSVSPKRSRIMVENAGLHGFVFFAPVELRRLHFIRGAGSTSQIFPLVGINHSKGESIVEDCVFFASTPEGEARSGGIGLSLADTPAAHIRESKFDGRQGILLSTRRASAPLTKMTVEDCFFSGEVALEIRQRESGAPGIRLELNRCAAEVDRLISQQHLGSFPNLDVRISRCAIFFRNSCLAVAKADQTTFLDQLRWLGEENLYGNTGDFVRVFEPSGPESGLVRGLSAFTELPAIEETDSAIIDPSGFLDSSHPAHRAWSLR